MIRNQTHIDSLVAEIIAIDPSLRGSEDRMKAALQTLLETSPNLVPDARFVAKLREHLIQMPESRTLFNRFPFMRSPVLVGVSVFSLVAVVGLGVYVSSLSGGQSERPVAYNHGTKMAMVAPEAFGSLMGGGEGMRDSASGDAVAVPVPTPLSGPAAPPVSPRVAGGGGTMAMSADMVSGKMIAPMVQFTYVYKGDPIVIPTDTPAVFRRKKGLDASANALMSSVSRLFPGVKLGSLSGLRFQNANLVQDVKDGYAVSVDFDDARISISPNYMMWYGRDTGTQNPLTISDVPSEEKLIAMANSFLETYGVDRALYGAPQVDMSWKEYYDSAPAENKYVPDAMTVNYPIRFNGHEVSEGYGSVSYGLRVTVDIRKQKVQGIWNLTTEEYEQSVYPLETDPENIKKVAENGGYSGGIMPFYRDANVKTETLSLGTPTLVYTQQYVYDADGGQGKELYVPAFSFPVTTKPSGDIYAPRTIIVPLPKELLKERLNPPQPVDGGPVIMLR